MREIAGSIVIQGEGINKFHAAQLFHACSLQAKHGLRMSRGSVIQQVNKEYGTSFRTAKQAAAFMQEVLVGKHPVNDVVGRRPT